jgi:hypothetical protein
MRVGIVASLLVALAFVLASCGSSDDDDDADLTVSGVETCLEEAGFGVTVIPAEDVAEGAAHNRGPGQTGQLLVGADGFEPQPEADESGAVVAFWDSEESASTAPGVDDPDGHIDVFGTISVQPTSLEGKPKVEEIEACVQE